MNNLPAHIQTALTERNIDIAMWNTLKNSVFPGAADESIILAADYCKARKLDIMKKPCHIVPMYVKEVKTGKSDWRDVIMPGIYEQRITAFRTGQMAGSDDPVFSETITYLGVEAPEWCRVTVYRFINGERCAFSHTEYFKEACATTEVKDQSGRKTGNLKINSVWSKRPRGQLAKCAEAGALRKAFPDELGGVITADEVVEEPTLNEVNVTKSNVIDTQAVELISDEQVEQLKQLVEITQSDLNGVLAACGADTVEKITKANAERALKKLNDKLNKQQIQDDNLGDNIPL